MPKLVHFENTFFEYFENETATDALACCTIDGHPADENLPGAVVTRIWLTKHGGFIIDWHDNGYRLNNHVNNLIKETCIALKQYYSEYINTTASTNTITNFIGLHPEISYINACLSGIAAIDDIDAYIEYWHTHDTRTSLTDFLGMTREEYSRWLKSGTGLEDILHARKVGSQKGIIIPSVDDKLAKVIRRNYIGQNNLHYRIIKQFNNLSDELLDHALTHDVEIQENRNIIVRLLVKLLITIQLMLNNYNATQDEINDEFNQQIAAIKNNAKNTI